MLRIKRPSGLGAIRWALLPHHGWAAACGEEKLDISENKVSGSHK
jgi:hypothetical protein